MGFVIALFVLVLLAILPLGISAVYNARGPLVRLIAGPIRLQLYPQKKEKAKKEKSQKQAPQKKKEEKNGGSVKDFLPLAKVALDLVADLKAKLRVNRLEMKLTLAGGDPCDLSVNYGKAWVALGNVMPRLEELFVIKKRDMEVQCDFTAETTVVYARVDITITLGRLTVLAVRYGIRGLKTYYKIMNERKGGAK